MKLGIIGSGNIGGALARHWSKAKHQVMISSRHPERLNDLANDIGENAQTGTVKQASSFGDVILLASPYGMLPQIHEQIGNLNGKILIDATNYYLPRDGSEIKVQMNTHNSLESEWTAKYFSGASVIKAFNTIPAKGLLKKAFAEKDEQKSIPYATDNIQSAQVMEKLLTDIGFRPVYIGQLSESRIMEPNQVLYNGFISKKNIIRFQKDIQQELS